MYTDWQFCQMWHQHKITVFFNWESIGINFLKSKTLYYRRWATGGCSLCKYDLKVAFRLFSPVLAPVWWSNPSSTFCEFYILNLKNVWLETFMMKCWWCIVWPFGIIRTVMHLFKLFKYLNVKFLDVWILQTELVVNARQNLFTCYSLFV